MAVTKFILKHTVSSTINIYRTALEVKQWQKLEGNDEGQHARGGGEAGIDLATSVSRAFVLPFKEEAPKFLDIGRMQLMAEGTISAWPRMKAKNKK